MGNCGEKYQIKGKMFRGNYTYSIDNKGRISIPAKLRKHVASEANDTFIMTRGTATCIDIYPMDQWQKVEERLSKLNSFNPEEALFKRMISHYATDGTLDTQSRLLLPQSLIEYAKIDNEVLILGAMEKIEAWNPKIYDEYIKQTGQTYEQIAAKVMK